MHILGIGDSIEVSGHAGIVDSIDSIVNLDSLQRMPVVFVKLNAGNRMVSVLGNEIEKLLDNAG